MPCTNEHKKKVLLAYSGGLDTSCILVWLKEQGYEVLAYAANIGQNEDFEAAKAKALSIGASKVFIEDLREEFVNETVLPAIHANCLYEGVYLLGTALARPIIAQRQVEIALREECQYVAHGCTGKGNDQVRFELAYYALCPEIKVIAPWRMKEFNQRFRGRQDLIAYAKEKNIPVQQTSDKPWSTDENIFHISYEAGILENPLVSPPKEMWKMTTDPEDAPNEPEEIEIQFVSGTPVSLKSKTQTVTGSPLTLLEALNDVGSRHGVGRIDIVENRFIGIKSRGCYETPGATILRAAHLDLEGLCLDKEIRKFKDGVLGPKLGEILYNGFWFSPERLLVSHSIDFTQRVVTGSVRVKLYKGSATILGRSSPYSLYDEDMASMDSALSRWFEPTDVEGFIKVQSMRLGMGWQMSKDGQTNRK